MVDKEVTERSRGNAILLDGTGGDGCGNSGGESDSQQARGTVRIQSAPVRAAGIAALGQSLRSLKRDFHLA